MLRLFTLLAWKAWLHLASFHKTQKRRSYLCSHFKSRRGSRMCTAVAVCSESDASSSTTRDHLAFPSLHAQIPEAQQNAESLRILLPSVRYSFRIFFSLNSPGLTPVSGIHTHLSLQSQQNGISIRNIFNHSITATCLCATSDFTTLDFLGQSHKCSGAGYPPVFPNVHQFKYVLSTNSSLCSQLWILGQG